MRRAILTLAMSLALLCEVSAASAHAFLDHASPSVGSTVAQPPKTITLWFTEKLEPAFSGVEVFDASGGRVDLSSQVVSSDATVLRAELKPLPPGTYKVVWRVVSVDTHATNGDFTFRVTAS
jgi:methionine-rich copper-binding protein CopC